jgi:hypothetical protein
VSSTCMLMCPKYYIFRPLNKLKFKMSTFQPNKFQPIWRYIQKDITILSLVVGSSRKSEILFIFLIFVPLLVSFVKQHGQHLSLKSPLACPTFQHNATHTCDLQDSTCSSYSCSCWTAPWTTPSAPAASGSTSKDSNSSTPGSTISTRQALLG